MTEPPLDAIDVTVFMADGGEGRSLIPAPRGKIDCVVATDVRSVSVDTPERSMVTASGFGAGGGAMGAAAGTMLATLVAGGLGFIMGLMWGQAKGEETGYLKGRA